MISQYNSFEDKQDLFFGWYNSHFGFVTYSSYLCSQLQEIKAGNIPLLILVSWMDSFTYRNRKYMLVLRSGMLELHLRSPTRLHGMVLNNRAQGQLYLLPYIISQVIYYL
jgi:hypothetical protein